MAWWDRLQPVQGELRSPGPGAGGRGCVSTCRRMEVWHASRESAISRLTCSRARFTGRCGGRLGACRSRCESQPISRGCWRRWAAWRWRRRPATPVELADDLFNAMRARFDERQLVELTSAIAWENYRARFDRAFGCAAEGFSEGAFCPMPARPLLHGEIDQGDDQDGKEQSDPHQREQLAGE